MASLHGFHCSAAVGTQVFHGGFVVGRGPSGRGATAAYALAQLAPAFKYGPLAFNPFLDFGLEYGDA